MKIILVMLLLTLSVFKWSANTLQADPPDVTAKFPGAALKWIHIAEPEFERKKLDLSKYTVFVVDQDDSVVVILRALGLSENVTGSMGKYPGYSVEISKKDLKIIQENYAR
jgi:hypothetical protein